MDQIKQLIIVLLTLMLGACASAPQQPVAFDASAISGGGNHVAIQMEKIPETDTSFPGADCLLCIGVARAAHSDLSTQVQSLIPDELNALPDRLAEILRSTGAQVTVLDQPVDIDSLSKNAEKGDNQNLAAKDFRPLANKLGADKLLVLNFSGQGVVRAYASYVPTDIPKAFISGAAYMVDLKTNTYLWYSPINRVKPAEGAWNEPPSFPGLTNAYYQVLAETSDSLASELSQQVQSTPDDNGTAETIDKVAQ